MVTFPVIRLVLQFTFHKDKRENMNFKSLNLYIVFQENNHQSEWWLVP